ncbi:MAG: penicillin acylase family protein [Gordonia sp. (in: high G+C Gram-positive bacteria)]
MTPADHDGEIIRDEWGIPHIHAQSPAGALYGQGRACGLDRAWQIEFMRLRAEGRTAQVFGADTLGWDIFARRARIDHAARRIFTASSARTQALITAYVDGVNATVRSAAAVEFDTLDHRPDRWQPWTPIAVFLMHNLLFGRFTTKMWRVHACTALGVHALRLFDFEGADRAEDAPPLPDDDFIADVVAHFAGSPQSVGLQSVGTPASDIPRSDTSHLATIGDAISGSNAWGIAARRTATGSPLIAGDPHRFLELPGVYVQNHLACPEFDAIGFSFAGVPGLAHFAHNGSVAWGITNGMGDYQDLYLERLHRDGTTVSAYGPQGYEPAQVSTEQILVRDGDPVAVDIIRTGNGSVVFGDPDDGAAVSLRTPMLNDPKITFDASVDLLFARNTADVAHALRSWAEPVNRIVIGDENGTVTHHVTGAMPVRAAENYWLPVPGWDARFRWNGYADLEAGADDGARFDPIVAQYSVIANQRIPDCPPLQPVSTECTAPLRANRIDELLAPNQSISVADCEQISRDVKLGQAEVICRLIATTDELSDGARAIADRILGWDRLMAADSTDAYLFAEVRTHLVRGLAGHPAFAGLARPHPFGAVFDPWFLPQPRMAAAIEAVLTHTPALGIDLADLTRSALDSLAAQIDSLDTIPTWSSVHTLAPVHGFDLVGISARYPETSKALRPTPHPLAGDAECVFANAAVVGFGIHTCNLGSTARYVWDLGERDRSRWIVPLGASGAPGTAHFEDQTPLWARGEYIDVVTDWSQLRDIASRIDQYTYSEENS